MTKKAPLDLYTIAIETIDGKKTTLAPYKNKVLLIVNVASRCGFTKQYAPLQSLFERYKDKGLVILGFPCDQFAHQEPGDNAEIATFAHSCFRITFPMFAKVNVLGPHRSPIYTYLATHIQKKPILSTFLIPWNFTKFLVDAKGNVIKRFAPWSSFRTIQKNIDALLRNL